MVDGVNLYRFVRSNPLTTVDQIGTQAGPYTSNLLDRQLAQTARRASEAVEKVVSEVIEGDFYEGESTWVGLAMNVLVGFTPAGVVADIRDTAAATAKVYKDPGSGAAWAGLPLAAVAWVPGFGDAIKGGVTAARQGAQRAAREGVEQTVRHVDEASELRKVAPEAPTPPATPASASIGPPAAEAADVTLKQDLHVKPEGPPQIHVPKKLTRAEKDTLREEARAIATRVTGKRLPAGSEIHHRIPLEFAHTQPHLDPNRLENLIIVRDRDYMGTPRQHFHNRVHDLWQGYLKGFKDPSADELENIAKEIDKGLTSAKRWTIQHLK